MLLLSAGSLQAQSDIYASFDQFSHNLYLTNPAATDSSYNFLIRAGNKTQTGLFSGVSNFYFDGDLKLERASGTGYHFFGAQFLNNKEGEFINRNYFFGRYGWYQQLADNSALSAGFTVGMINYLFQNSQGGVSGSDFSPDASLGINLMTGNFTFGIASQQLFTPVIQPLDQRITLNPHYNFTITHLAKINSDFLLKTHLYYRMSALVKNDFSLCPVLQVYRNYEFGLNYRFQRGVVFMAGLNEIEFLDTYFSVHASYRTSIQNLGVPDNAVELFLSIRR